MITLSNGQGGKSTSSVHQLELHCRVAVTKNQAALESGGRSGGQKQAFPLGRGGVVAAITVWRSFPCPLEVSQHDRRIRRFTMIISWLQYMSLSVLKC